MAELLADDFRMEDHRPLGFLRWLIVKLLLATPIDSVRSVDRPVPCTR